MQIDVISPEGKLVPHQLDPQRGIANIGRNRANELSLVGLQVAEFHAMLDYRRMPYRLFVLAGTGGVTVGRQLVAAGQSIEVSADDPIDVAGFLLIIRVATGAEKVLEPVNAPPLSNGTGSTLGGSQKSLSPNDIPSQPLFSQSEQTAGLEMEDSRVIFLGAPFEGRFEPIEDDKQDLVQSILVEIPERKADVEVRETATWSIKLTNGGRRVGVFQINLEVWHQGGWTRIEADEERGIAFQYLDPQKKRDKLGEVSLDDNETAMLNLRITPPRHPQSLAGRRRMAIVVTSPDYRGYETRRGISLHIKPFYRIAVGQVMPHQQTIAYRQPFGRFALPIENRGNARTPVQVSGTDTEQSCIFEFEETGTESQIGSRKFFLPAGQSATIALRVRPKTRPLVASKVTEYKLHLVTEVAGGGQPPELRHPVLLQKPRYRYWQIVLLGLLLSVITLRGIIWLLTPKIYDFKVASAQTLQPGDTGTLIWRTSSFPRRLTVVEQANNPKDTIPTELTSAQRSDQAFPFTAKVGRSYALRMESQLSRFQKLMDTLGFTTIVTATPSASITVTGTQLAVALEVDPQVVTAGEEVQVKWQELKNVNEYTLLVDETPVPVATLFSYSDRPQKNTRYQLQVNGPLIELTRSNPVIVEVMQPTPVIEEFRVAPAEVAPGDKVNVFWRVSGANLEIQMTPVAPTTLLPEGTLQVEIPALQPIGTYTFTIKAIANGTPVSTQGINQRSVAIGIAPATPMPSATPVPTPDIKRFSVEPKEVILGQSVRISWDVAGASEIAITPVIGKVDVNAGERLAPMTTPGPQQLVLQAKSSAPESTGVAEEIIEVNVLLPTATATSTSAPTATSTPTLTPVPAPQIPVFEASGEGVSLLAKEGNTATYSADIRKSVNLRWVIKDAKGIKLNKNNQDFLADLGAEQTITIRVLPEEEYRLTATSFDDDPNKITNSIIKFRVTAPERPPAPTNITVQGGQTMTDTATVTWDYSGDPDLIIGFRVYRADINSTEFTRKADELELERTKTKWVDDETPTCGKTYFVVGIYEDFSVDPPVKRETDPTNSYNMLPCVPS